MPRGFDNSPRLLPTLSSRGARPLRDEGSQPIIRGIILRLRCFGDPPLKFPCFLARPTLHDDFRLGVELHRVFALRVKNPEEAFFPAAEREIRHRRSYSNVDTDISGGSFVAEFARRGAAGGEERRLVPV